VTSSVNLRRVPDTAEHWDAVAAALTEVAENSFFAFVDPVETEAAAEFAAGLKSWLVATVVFSGAFGGTMKIAVAEPLARELFGAFLGLDPSESPEDGALFDLVGEFGNMVCGSWLTRSCQRRRFDLDHPVVERVAGDAAIDWQAVRPLALNGQPVWLHLEFAE
jgi:hypothetical protein